MEEPAWSLLFHMHTPRMFVFAGKKLVDFRGKEARCSDNALQLAKKYFSNENTAPPSSIKALISYLSHAIMNFSVRRA